MLLDLFYTFRKNYYGESWSIDLVSFNYKINGMRYKSEFHFKNKTI
jgi:hypothetical protein